MNKSHPPRPNRVEAKPTCPHRLRSALYQLICAFTVLSTIAWLDPSETKARGEAKKSVPKLRVALYGSNGHQLRPKFLAEHPFAELAGVAGLSEESLSTYQGVRRYTSLNDILSDPDVDLVSLCSPIRANQAQDAIKCLAAGKHVYAEKPSALNENDLDLIIATAKKYNKSFHEMAGTGFVSPHIEMRREILEGSIGEVLQVLVEKSYPYGDSAPRPQNEDVDGGLLLQIGIHAMRLVEHVANVRVQSVSALESSAGNPLTGDLKMSAIVQMRFENGGIGTIVVNYLNPRYRTPRSHETLKIFGANGIIETTESGKNARVITEREERALISNNIRQNYSPIYFNYVSENLVTGSPMPLTLEEELRPLRLLLRAKLNKTQ